MASAKGGRRIADVNSAVERLLHRLDLQQGETSESTTTWHGEAGEGALNLSNRLFGGMVDAQTIVAAGRTYADREVHSVQQFFLRGGSADVPLRYRVDRLFTGRTYASARVEVHQGDHMISHAQIGLTSGIEGPDRQADAPSLPPVESMVNRDELRNRPNWDDQPVKMYIDAEAHDDGRPEMHMWMRPDGPMPDDPLMHKAVLGYVSDRGLMSVAWRPHANESAFKGATLDHSLWFHRPVRFDDWHSYSMHSPTIAGGRGLNHGEIHDHDGTHIASTTQQGTFRPI